jgi:hypothetical protein
MFGMNGVETFAVIAVTVTMAGLAATAWADAFAAKWENRAANDEDGDYGVIDH